MMADMDGLIDSVLRKAAARGAAAEIFYESSEDRPAEFDDGRLKYLATKSGRGMGLRVILDGRIGFSSTSDFARLDDLVEHALESAKFGQEARFEFPAACVPAAVQTWDDRVANLPAARMVELGEAAIERLKARHPDVQYTADIGAEVSEEHLVNSSGLHVSHRSTLFDFGVSALAVRDDGLVWTGDGRASSLLIEDTTPITDKIIRDLDLAKREAAIATGDYPAIFTPDAMGTLLLSMSEGVNGKLVQKGASPLGGRLGERIADARVTITDDATIDFAASSAPYDTEGIRSTRTPIIESGVLRTFLFDLQTAGIMGVYPTGNGLRDYGSQPAPGHNNTVVAPGDTTFEQMLRGMKRGLLVDSVLGGGLGNTLAGEFSVNVELGFLVENGELIGRVKNCMLFGNVYDLLKDGVAAIGDRPEMKGSLSVPHFLFKSLSVGAQ